jgi:transcriptional regulator with XRE-family HTH domain
MTKLQAERLRRRLTQTELAAAARLAASEISRFETGMARPYPAQALRLADLLQIPASELLDDAPLAHPVELRSARR